MGLDLTQKVWWGYLDEDLQELLKESFVLADQVGVWSEKFHDYAFVTFPAAKAYEGFLKKLFFDMGFINHDQYYGKRFRIGKALNPQLERELRHESVYDKLAEFCHGKSLPDKLWDTWRECRNTIFHWFPEERKVINFDQAKAKVHMIIEAIDMAFETCKINKDDAQ